MPRVSQSSTNFTAGELSPRLAGRVDIDRYANAAKYLLNCYPVIHGGALRRAGTLYIAGTKTNAKKSRLIPFIQARDNAFMLEFGDLYMRVFKNGASLGYEVATPFTEAMLPDIDYVQSSDTMFLAHASVPLQRVRSFSDTSWDVSAAPFTTIPFDEQGYYPATTGTLSSASVGAGRTLTAGSAVFLPSDVGRQLVSGAGIGVVTAYTDSTHVTVTITVAFSGTALASGAWYLDVSPQAIVKPSAKDPVASIIDLSSSMTRAADITLSAKTGAITVTASAGVFAAGDVGKILYADSGVAAITVFTDASHVNATTSADFASLTYATGGYGITESAWRAEDVGKFVRINGGLVKITTFTSATAVKAQIVTALTGIVASPPLAWSMEAAVWSAANGYPRTVTLHEQRLIAAGSTKYPQTIWGSRTGEYTDFTKGVNDDDSFSFTIASDEINPISYVASLRNLIVLTYGGEFSLQGGIEKPITPTNVRIRPESAHGSKGVRPVLVGRESIYVQRAGRKVRAMGYQYNVDGYVSPDLSVLAEHITEGGVTMLAYQQEPDLILWGIRGDGALLSCTIDRDQSVTGWARHYTDGAFESVATIPAGDREETWVIVRRTISGATVRYVERLDETFKPQLVSVVSATAYPPVPADTVYRCTVDCGKVIDNAIGQTVFTGLAHLEGKTVAILADGAVQPNQTVTGGQITLSRLSYRTLIGLPFVSQIALLTPEIGTGTGTAQGSPMRTSDLTFRFLDTLGAKLIDGDGIDQTVAFRRFGPDVLDVVPVPFTGSTRIETLGWDLGKSEFTIEQDQPLPMHLLSVVRTFQVNN
jgi:hypothetical protein